MKSYFNITYHYKMYLQRSISGFQRFVTVFLDLKSHFSYNNVLNKQLLEFLCHEPLRKFINSCGQTSQKNSHMHICPNCSYILSDFIDPLKLWSIKNFCSQVPGQPKCYNPQSQNELKRLLCSGLEIESPFITMY